MLSTRPSSDKHNFCKSFISLVRGSNFQLFERDVSQPALSGKPLSVQLLMQYWINIVLECPQQGRETRSKIYIKLESSQEFYLIKLIVGDLRPGNNNSHFGKRTDLLRLLILTYII